MFFQGRDTMSNLLLLYKFKSQKTIIWLSMLIIDSEQQILEALLTGEDLISDLQADIL